MDCNFYRQLQDITVLGSKIGVIFMLLSYNVPLKRNNNLVLLEFQF